MVWYIKGMENVIANILFYKSLGLSNNDNRRIKGNIKD
jgi:hypothetical protein